MSAFASASFDSPTSVSVGLRGFMGSVFKSVHPINSALYQIPMILIHMGDTQGGDFLIHRSKHEEACDGGGDWCSNGLHFDGFGSIFSTM